MKLYLPQRKLLYPDVVSIHSNWLYTYSTLSEAALRISPNQHMYPKRTDSCKLRTHMQGMHMPWANYTNMYNEFHYSCMLAIAVSIMQLHRNCSLSLLPLHTCTDSLQFNLPWLAKWITSATVAADHAAVYSVSTTCYSTDNFNGTVKKGLCDYLRR